MGMATTATQRIAQHRQTLRHLSICTYPGRCEMESHTEDETDCGEVAAYYLTAPASYVKPLLLCAANAEDEKFYFGTPIPSR